MYRSAAAEVPSLQPVHLCRHCFQLLTEITPPMLATLAALEIGPPLRYRDREPAMSFVSNSLLRSISLCARRSVHVRRPSDVSGLAR